MEQQPPSRIEELEQLVSNLRRDLQVAHDRLIAVKSALEKAREALKHWHSYFQTDIPKTGDEQDQQGEDFTLAWYQAEQALAAINEVLK